MVALAEGRSPMTSSDNEMDYKPIILFTCILFNIVNIVKTMQKFFFACSNNVHIFWEFQINLNEVMRWSWKCFPCSVELLVQAIAQHHDLNPMVAKRIAEVLQKPHKHKSRKADPESYKTGLSFHDHCFVYFCVITFYHGIS